LSHAELRCKVNEVVPFCVLATLFIALIAFVFNPMEERVCMLECCCVGTKFIAVYRILCGADVHSRALK